MKKIQTLILFTVLALFSGCASSLTDSLTSTSSFEFKEFHRASPYSEIWIEAGEEGTKDVKYTYKIGPFYNASATIKGFRLNKDE